MEVRENTKDLLKIKFENIDQGILSAVKDQLWKDKATETAGYRITHPQVGHAIFTLRTKGKAAKTVWNNALSALTKDFEALTKSIKKL